MKKVFSACYLLPAIFLLLRTFMPLRFAFALHNHQPVGNFDNVFAQAYGEGYAPFLDDYHFNQAGIEEDDLRGYFLTEDQGFLLKVFPISETLRYMTPWKDPSEAIAYLDLLAETYPDSVVVCADDGEKFGVWPGTFK